MQEEYRSTLNLFQTEFPIRADAAKTDKEIQDMWKSIDICNGIKDQNKSQPLFFLPINKYKYCRDNKNKV